MNDKQPDDASAESTLMLGSQAEQSQAGQTGDARVGLTQEAEPDPTLAVPFDEFVMPQLDEPHPAFAEASTDSKGSAVAPAGSLNAPGRSSSTGSKESSLREDLKDLTQRHPRFVLAVAVIGGALLAVALRALLSLSQ